MTFPDDLSSVERRQLNAVSPVVIEAQKLIDDIDRGEDIVIPSWCVGGNSHPEGRQIPWIADHSVSSIVVSADDTIHPA